MKAVIVEVKGSNAAILSEDGRISQIKNRNYKIGQEISMSNNSYAKWALTAAAAMLLFVTPAWAYMTPYSYVSLDVNPSFEFSINRFDRVLEVKAVNGDAEKMIEEINIDGLKNKEIKDAVRNVLTELKNQGYITEGEDGGVILATSSKSEEKTNNLAAALKTAVDEEVGKDKDKDKDSLEASKDTKNTETSKNEENKDSKETENTEDENSIALEDDKNKDKYENKNKDKDKINEEENASDKDEDIEDKDEDDETGVEVEVIKVSQQKVDEAKEKGFTPGKVNLVDKLAEASGDEDFDKEEWLDKSVKEIMDATKNYQKESKNKDKDTEESVEFETESNENGNQGNGNGNSGGKKN